MSIWVFIVLISFVIIFLIHTTDEILSKYSYLKSIGFHYEEYDISTPNIEDHRKIWVRGDEVIRDSQVSEMSFEELRMLVR